MPRALPRLSVLIDQLISQVALTRVATCARQKSSACALAHRYARISHLNTYGELPALGILCELLQIHHPGQSPGCSVCATGDLYGWPTRLGLKPCCASDELWKCGVRLSTCRCKHIPQICNANVSLSRNQLPRDPFYK